MLNAMIGAVPAKPWAGTPALFLKLWHAGWMWDGYMTPGSVNTFGSQSMFCTFGLRCVSGLSNI